YDRENQRAPGHKRHFGKPFALHAMIRVRRWRTGLLDTTLVIWQAEFARMPISQRGGWNTPS
ncbi:MAG TPA: hypothetical protein VEU62_02290, partial [Bryobacterales bacterium]|nr:hypothetical protein [Bryobacterales bacterium]